MAKQFKQVRAAKSTYGIGIGFALTVHDQTERQVEDFANLLADQIQVYADQHGYKTSDVAYDFKTVELTSADLVVKNELTPRVTFANAVAGADQDDDTAEVKRTTKPHSVSLAPAENM